MQIRVPDNKKVITKDKALALSIRAKEKKKLIKKNPNDYSYKISEKYWPYWVAVLSTLKERFLFGPKKISFFIVCNGVSGEYSILRNLPSFTELECDGNNLIKYKLNKEEFLSTIHSIQREKIPKLFIFGPPAQKLKNIFKIYIPFWHIRLIKEDKQVEFFVNSFNGEVIIGDSYKCL